MQMLVFFLLQKQAASVKYTIFKHRGIKIIVEGMNLKDVFVNVKANAIFNKYAQLSKEIHNYEGN